MFKANFFYGGLAQLSCVDDCFSEELCALRAVKNLNDRRRVVSFFFSCYADSVNIRFEFGIDGVMTSGDGKEETYDEVFN